MTKHKATTDSKTPRSPRASKAQRAKPVVMRSPEPSDLRSVAADPIKSSPQGHDDPKQESPIVESPATALQDTLKTLREADLKKEFDFFSPMATAQAYQAKLIEMAQGNMQFALECAQRFAAIRSPVELLHVFQDLTNKRIAMFRKYSIEMVELSMKR